MTDRTPTAIFWGKLATKKWLAEHAPELSPAETYAKELKRNDVPQVLRELHETRGLDRFVVKPHKGRNGRGIALVELTREGQWRFPWGTVVGDGGLVKQLTHDLLEDYRDCYFVEERFDGHPALREFAFFPRTTPLFRLLFGARRFIVGALYTASRKAKGFAQILVGGQCFWFDDTGLIRPPEDMAPPYGGRNGDYLSRTFDTDEYNYLTIEGMADLISYCEVNICPKVQLDDGRNWGIDVVIELDGQPRIVEVNHSPGCQMRNWAGWKPLTPEQLLYVEKRGGLLGRGPS